MFYRIVGPNLYLLSFWLVNIMVVRHLYVFFKGAWRKAGGNSTHRYPIKISSTWNVSDINK